MITKADILKMVRGVRKKAQGRYEHKVINPHREWYLGLLLFVVIVVVGVVVNARSYIFYDTLEQNVTDNSEPLERYRQSLVMDALERYEERVAVYQMLQSNTPTVVPEPTELPPPPINDFASGTPPLPGTSTPPFPPPPPGVVPPGTPQTPPPPTDEVLEINPGTDQETEEPVVPAFE